MSKQQIVVGVDGSPDSRDALLWAAETARLVGGTLRVVYAWSLGGIASLGIPPLPDYRFLEERARQFPIELARDVLGEDPPVDVVSVAVRGNAAQVLVDASAKADLFVIGSRGLGGLKDMVLGGRPPLRRALALSGRDLPQAAHTQAATGAPRRAPRSAFGGPIGVGVGRRTLIRPVGHRCLPINLARNY